MQQARNDEKFWYEKVLPLQRKLRSKLKSLDESPKPLQSRTYYVHTDHLGTPRELTNNSGDIVWAVSYKAWGATASIEHPPTQQTVQVGNTVQTQWVQPLKEEVPEQNLRFQGQYFDEEMGLHYNRFRYYDPDCGRFVSQDPIGLRGGDNLYQYSANPITWIDPLGLAGSTVDGAGNTVPTSSQGIPNGPFTPKPGTGAYSRVGAAGPTTAQTASVQGKPCAVCGATDPKMVADHKDPLVVEHYRTGSNDINKQTSTSAVQPHCRKCSSSQGGQASVFSRAMKRILGL